MDWNTSKKKYLMGFIVGNLVTGFLFWLIALKTPSLSNLRAEGSYALGNSMGKNLKRQKIDIDLRVFMAAIQDAADDKSQIPEEKMRAGMDFIQKASAEARKNDPPPQVVQNAAPPVAAAGNTVAATGAARAGEPVAKTEEKEFKNSPFGFKYKSEDADLQETIDPRNFKPNRKMSFHVVIRDSSGREIFSSLKTKKPYNLLAGQLPFSLQMALAMIPSQKKMQIQFVDRDEQIILDTLKIPLRAEVGRVYEINRVGK